MALGALGPTLRGREPHQRRQQYCHANRGERAPDGYTLLTVVTANAINATLYEKLDFDFLRDIAPIAGLIRLPMVLLVNPSFPAGTFAEFIAYAKANPGKINIASPGVGTPMHVAIELLKLQAGLDLVHIAYRGPAAAFTDCSAAKCRLSSSPSPRQSVSCAPARRARWR